MIKIGDKKVSEIIFKVGDKVKRISVKMKVDNNIEDFILYSILKSMEYNSGLLLYGNHSHTIEINDLVSIEDITVNNGEVTYSVNGNKVTINAKNGKIIKQANPTKYQKDISEYRTSSSNNFDSSLDYNKDEYSGKLSKDGSSYVDSGSFESDDSKQITEYRTSNSNSFSTSLSYNSDGYTGSLSKDGSSYVDSGSYEPSASKQATDYRTSSSDSFSSSMSYNSGGYTGTLTKDGSSYVSSGSYEPSSSKQVTDYSTSSSNNFSSSMSYNSGGYIGTLSKSGSSYVTSGEYLSADTKSHGETAGWEYVLHDKNGSFPSTKNYSDKGNYSGVLQLKQKSDWNDTIWKTTLVEDRVVRNTLTLRKGDVVSWSNQYFGYPYPPNVTLTLGDSHKINCTFSSMSQSDKDSFTKAIMESMDKPNENVTVSLSANYKAEHVEQARRISFWYEGTISRPEKDTRVWRQNYSGTATKSGYDTRTYRQDYKGTVTKQGYDTRVWKQKYSGKVYKAGHDTRVWKQKYSGKVYKPGYDDRYKYLINIIYKQKTK